MDQKLQNEKLFEVVKKHHEKEEYADVPVQHFSLLPKLRPYQEKAVQWMVHKERQPILKEVFLNPVKPEENSCDSAEFIQKLYIKRLPTGGILADEMGLGKTVEVLACILTNPRIGVEIPTWSENYSENSMLFEGDDAHESSKPKEMQSETSSLNVKEEQEGEVERTISSQTFITEKEDAKVSLEFETVANKITSSETNDQLGLSSENPEPFEVKVKQDPDNSEHELMEVEQSVNQITSIQRDILTNKGLETDMLDEISEVPLAQRVIIRKDEKNKINKEKKAMKRKGGADKSVSSKKKPKKTAKSSIQRGEKKISQSKLAAEAWYASKLAEVNRNPIRSYYESMENSSISDVQCICGERDIVNLVKCSDCSRLLHEECIGASKWIGSQPVYCPQCWLKREPIQSRATLIVSPTSISSQWLSEVKNHISKDSNFKVLVYKGVKVDGFLQPYDYADYDLILTTYDVLRRELVLAETNERRSMRFEKRYFSPTCPLLCVDFWRICLDEAQMVEGTTTKAAEMVSRLTSIHRWAVTGTPIQKTLQDLYGLVMFLCVDPYCYGSEWKKHIFDPYCKGDKYPLYTLFAHIMWRSSKADVLDQIQIPPQIEQVWWLNFTPVEKHFYHRTHQQCSNDFLDRLNEFDSLDITLQSLKLVTVTKVLAPLLKLRQACAHPHAVRGNLIGCLKNTMTMSELLESLIKKTSVEAQEALRGHIAALNGMAGLHIVCHEYVSAAEKYREVLRMTEEYKDRIKVDTLPRLHTYHNLAEIIKEHKDIIPPTLRDDSLQEEASKLEKEYLSKAENAVSSAKVSLSDLTAAVKKIEKKKTDDDYDDGDWWVDICNELAVIDEDEMLRRVHDSLLDNRKSIPDITSGSIINKVSSLGGIKSLTLQWLEDLESNQKKVRKSLKTLEAANEEELVNESVNCHLRVSNLKSKISKSKCRLCECESFLKKYEINLCAVKNKKQENIMVGDVYLLGQTKEGSWKPSEQETVLRTILSFGKSKKLNPIWLKSGTTFLQLMDALRKELKLLRLLWSRINERTCARDELNMCKLRMRLRYPDEPSTSSTPSPHAHKRKKETNMLSSNIDFKTENLHVIESHQLEPMSFKFKLDAVSALSELKKKSGTVAYLQNLRSKGSDQQTNVELCPICRSTLEDRWAVLSCGHCYCMDCIPELLNKIVHFKPKSQIQCAICREVTEQSEISFVNKKLEDPTVDGSSSQDIEIPAIRGSLSTKVEGVVRRLLYLRAVDPSVKVLIFSTWERVLDVLEFALGENTIKFVRLKSGTSYEISLKKFKNMHEEETTTALLLPLKLGSKGLNLIEATHVFLVEPLLNPAEELQAIGRIHRIGQTKTTYVHRFLIRETIEERMYSAVQSSGKEQWNGAQVTLRQLKDLFPSASSAECPITISHSSVDV